MRGYSKDRRIKSFITKNGEILSGTVLNKAGMYNNIKKVRRENTKVLSGGKK